MVNASIYNRNTGATTTPIPSTIPFVGRSVGASYSFDQLTVKGYYLLIKVSGSFDERVLAAGGNYRITPALDVDAGIWLDSDGNHTTNRSIMGAAGADYALSKATALYGQFGIVNNHGLMNTGLSQNGPLYEGKGTSIGATVGIRHIF